MGHQPYFGFYSDGDGNQLENRVIRYAFKKDHSTVFRRVSRGRVRTGRLVSRLCSNPGERRGSDQDLF